MKAMDDYYYSNERYCTEFLSDDYKTTNRCSSTLKIMILIYFLKTELPIFTFIDLKRMIQRYTWAFTLRMLEKVISRDYIASMNICRSFVRYFLYGIPLEYFSQMNVNENNES